MVQFLVGIIKQRHILSETNDSLRSSRWFYSKCALD